MPTSRGWKGRLWGSLTARVCIALLLSIDGSADYNDLYTALTTTGADLGAPGFDFAHGYGRIDCRAAADALGGGGGCDTDPDCDDGVCTRHSMQLQSMLSLVHRDKVSGVEQRLCMVRLLGTETDALVKEIWDSGHRVLSVHKTEGRVAA